MLRVVYEELRESIVSQLISLFFAADACCPLAVHVGPAAEGPHRVVERISR